MDTAATDGNGVDPNLPHPPVRKQRTEHLPHGGAGGDTVGWHDHATIDEGRNSHRTGRISDDPRRIHRFGHGHDADWPSLRVSLALHRLVIQPDIAVPIVVLLTRAFHQDDAGCDEYGDAVDMAIRSPPPADCRAARSLFRRRAYREAHARYRRGSIQIAVAVREAGLGGDDCAFAVDAKPPPSAIRFET